MAASNDDDEWTETAATQGTRIKNCELVMYECPEKGCDAFFYEKKAYFTHLKLHDPSRKHACEICSRRFRYRYELKRHMTVHNEDKPYKCTTCDYQTGQEFKLKTHMRRHTAVKNDDGERARPFECSQCDYTTTSQAALHYHQRRHQDPHRFACSQCSFTASHAQHLEKHLATHAGAKQQCEKCGFTTSSTAVMKRHRDYKQCKPPKLYHCDQCDYVASSPARLNMHQETHLTLDQRRLHGCKDCGAKYANKQNLLYHRQSQHGDKTALLKCPLCDYETLTNNNLYNHMKWRHTAKKYRCPECSYRGVYPSVVKAHMMRMHGATEESAKPVFDPGSVSVDTFIKTD